VNWTHDQLNQLGYKPNPDGSYSHTWTAGVHNPKPQPPARPALDPPPKGEETRTPRTSLSITRHAVRLLDADNYAGGCKPLIDQLRYAHLIEDDDPETIEITFRQAKCKTKAEEMTTIEIREAVGIIKGGTTFLSRQVSTDTQQI